MTLERKELEFNEEQHEYYTGTTQLRSVTRWVNSHWPKFDANKIAPFTARAVRKEIRDYCGEEEPREEDYPRMVKLFRENWITELKARQGKKIPINAAEVKKLWAAYGKLSAEEGTRIHKLIEDCLNGEEDVLLQDERVVIAAVNKVREHKNRMDNVKDVYTELRIYSLPDGLAGTIDVVLESEDGVVLLDWKTNKDLHKKGRNRGITPETRPYYDSQVFKYTLQLSTYAYILEEEYGVPIKGLWLYNLIDDSAIPTEIPYEKELVRSMLENEQRNHL